MLKLCLPDGENKDRRRTAERHEAMLAWSSDGENKTDVGQLSDTKLCLPDGENKTDVGQLSDTKLCLPDGENKTGVSGVSRIWKQGMLTAGARKILLINIHESLNFWWFLCNLSYNNHYLELTLAKITAKPQCSHILVSYSIVDIKRTGTYVQRACMHALCWVIN